MLMGMYRRTRSCSSSTRSWRSANQGLSRFDALIDSCSKQRATDRHDDDRDGGRNDAGRFGLGWRSELPRADGVAVIGGLIVSTVVSLFHRASMFSVFDDFQQWLSSTWGQKRHGRRPHRHAATHGRRALASRFFV